jgi:hypothetical protein
MALKLVFSQASGSGMQEGVDIVDSVAKASDKKRWLLAAASTHLT